MIKTGVKLLDESGSYESGSVNEFPRVHSWLKGDVLAVEEKAQIVVIKDGEWVRKPWNCLSDLMVAYGPSRLDTGRNALLVLAGLYPVTPNLHILEKSQ